MRTQCNQRIMGSGLVPAFVEHDEMYIDQRPGYVRTENDPKTDQEYAALCGPVTTYSIKSSKEEQIQHGN